MSTKAKANPKPLPLADVLRDLAVLRSSGVDNPQMFNLNQSEVGNGNSSNAATPVQQSVAASHEFVVMARAAIRLHDSGKVEAEGSKIEQVRTQYEDLLEGLEG